MKLGRVIGTMVATVKVAGTEGLKLLIVRPLKADLSVEGEPFVIAKAGKPLVKVMALHAPEAGQQRRLGFMAGQIAVPEDFDRMGSAEIERLFGDEA